MFRFFDATVTAKKPYSHISLDELMRLSRDFLVGQWRSGSAGSFLWDDLVGSCKLAIGAGSFCKFACGMRISAGSFLELEVF